jgi:hypothetical protein
MSRTLAVRAGLILILASTGACSLARPLLFWRDPMIRGETKLLDENGAPLAIPAARKVTLNFIPRDGRIEDSVMSVDAQDSGDYRSPALLPGEYTVEAMLPGFAIETQTVQVRSHEHRRVDFALKRIRESKARSQREAHEDNIPHPGEVQILPPPF